MKLESLEKYFPHKKFVKRKNIYGLIDPMLHSVIMSVSKQFPFIEADEFSRSSSMLKIVHRDTKIRRFQEVYDIMLMICRCAWMITKSDQHNDEESVRGSIVSFAFGSDNFGMIMLTAFDAKLGKNGCS